MYAFPLLDYILVAARIGGMIFTAPIFGSRNYPTQLKIALMLLLTIIIFPLVPRNLVYDLTTFADFGFHLVSELLIGIFIGLIMTFYFNFIYFAGDLIDRNIGFAMVNVINPLDESQIAITSNFFYVFAMLIFLQLDLHHELISAVILSFQEITLGTSFFSVTSYPILLDIVVDSFIIGFRISAPFLITVLIANIILGLLSKAMPGMNVFILGMPFKIFFGFLVFIIIMPFLYETFSATISDGFSYFERFFNLF